VHVSELLPDEWRFLLVGKSGASIVRRLTRLTSSVSRAPLQIRPGTQWSPATHASHMHSRAPGELHSGMPTRARPANCG
jgi:hypothetical protein